MAWCLANSDTRSSNQARSRTSKPSLNICFLPNQLATFAKFAALIRLMNAKLRRAENPRLNPQKTAVFGFPGLAKIQTGVTRNISLCNFVAKMSNSRAISVT